MKGAAANLLLKIGDFARLAGTTVKTLRFYDKARVFRPAIVDSLSGYRFYRVGQLQTLHHVRLLRELGCSVAEVRELIALPVDCPQYILGLTTLRHRLMVGIARDEQRLRQLDALLGLHAGGDAQSAQCLVRQRRIAPIAALTVRERVQSVGREVQRMFEATEQRVARYQCRAQRSPFLLFHNMEYRDERVDVEVCVPITPSALAVCGGRIVDGVDRAACVRFRGSYDQAPLLYERSLHWMQDAGTRIAGAIREVYLRFGAEEQGYTLAPRMLANVVDDYETELQIPIVDA